MNQPGLGPPGGAMRVWTRRAAPPDRLMRKYLPRAVSAAATGQRAIDFVLSTDAVDRQADRIAVGGWRLDAYRRNPIVLWAHDASQPPIARATAIGVEAGVLKATAEFVDAATYPFADTIYRLLAAGYLNACSVGFRPLEAKPADDPARPRGFDILAQELVEFSVVPIPANAEALVEARAFGIDTTPVADWLVRRLDLDGEAFDRDVLDQARRAADPFAPRYHGGARLRVTTTDDDPDGYDDPEDPPDGDEPDADDPDALVSIDPALLDPERLARVIADAIHQHLSGDPAPDDDDPENPDRPPNDPDDFDEGSES